MQKKFDWGWRIGFEDICLWQEFMEQIHNQSINHGRVPCPIGIVKQRLMMRNTVPALVDETDFSIQVRTIRPGGHAWWRYGIHRILSWALSVRCAQNPSGRFAIVLSGCMVSVREGVALRMLVRFNAFASNDFPALLCRDIGMLTDESSSNSQCLVPSQRESISLL